jgi:hypothetical protein
MPFYPRVYSPGERQFITTSTYRTRPFSSPIAFGAALCGGLRRCGRNGISGSLDYMHNNPVARGLVEFPRGLAVVKLEVLLWAGCVHSPHGSDALS